MNRSFLKFKRGLLAVNIVKAALCAIALGLTVSGALLLLTNYEIIGLDQIYILPISLVVLLLSGGGSFLLIRTSDMRVASSLDKRYSLEERVQTMLQYKDEEGAIFELQRKDAEEALAAAKTASLKLRGLWIYVLALLLGAAVFTLGLILKPEPTPPPPEVEVPFSLTEIQREAIEELIVYVESSDMESPYRENTAAHLDLMLEELIAATTTKMRDSAVSKATGAILAEVDESSSGLEVINALGATGNPGVLALARALNFYDWLAGGEWDDYTDAMAKFRASLTTVLSEEEAGDGASALLTAKLVQLLTDTGSGIPTALRGSGVSSQDPFYIAADSYASYIVENGDGSSVLGIARLADLAGELGYDETQRRLDGLFTALSGTTFTALETDYVNVSVGEYAVTRVCILLGVPIPRFDRPLINRDPSGGSAGGDSGEGSGGGGIGVGTVYGSDDLVLDPMTGEYVEYGTILDGYFYDADLKMSEGAYSEEDKKAIEKYYDILYGGFDKGDNNNE